MPKKRSGDGRDPNRYALLIAILGVISALAGCVSPFLH